MRLAIALEVLKRIPKRGWVTTHMLQEHLESIGIRRNIRSVQRLMNELSETLPIHQDKRDQTYGYRWKPEAQVELSIPGLNNLEALLLLLAKEHVGTILPPSLMKDMEPFFNEARNKLVGSARSPESEWRSKVAISQRTHALLAPDLEEGVFETISECLFANREVEVRYRNRLGEEREHQLRPYGLVNSSPALYLVAAMAHAPHRIGAFALHRAIEARASTIHFQRPNDFNLDEFVEEGKFAYGDGSRVQLSFEIAKSAGLHLTEAPLSDDQTFEELEAAYRFKATVANSMRLKNFLYGISGEVIGDIEISPIPKETPR